jgi:predicted oxidoreductase
VLQAVGQELGEASLDQVALAWVLAHPARFVPILGSSKIERIRSATGAEVLRLSREQWFAIWCASTGTPVP